MTVQTKAEWIESLVARKRERGGYTEDELAQYREQLAARYAHYSEEEFGHAVAAVRAAGTMRGSRRAR